MEPIRIRYRFHFETRPEEVIELGLHPDSLALVEAAPAEPPAWTALEFEQCGNCPLAPQQSPRCPLATALTGIVGRFADVVSHDELRLEVETEERIVTQTTSAQRALSSLMGVVMAGSGCPHTAWFRPMARFHLPLSSHEETVYRAAGMYLLAQYFLKRDGGEADLALEGLGRIYEDLATVNVGIANRLRAAIDKDSAVNALVLLDVHAQMFPLAIETSLDQLRPLFEFPYLSDPRPPRDP